MWQNTRRLCVNFKSRLVIPFHRLMRSLPSNRNKMSNRTPVDCEIQTCNNQLVEGGRNLSRFNSIGSVLTQSLRWRPTSEQELEDIESELLAVIKRPFRSYFVNIGPGWGELENKIRTIEMLTDEEINKSKDESAVEISTEVKPPLVMVHGFACGVGIWLLNLDKLASTVNRKVYAFDLIGFGRSSRSNFDLSRDVEDQFVESIDKWRQEQDIDKFILLGHSFGGYLSACYALRHPDKVSHLILADPWGVQERRTTNRVRRFPIWVRVVNWLLQPYNSLAVLRVSGPYGPRIVQRVRGDLREKFRPILGDDCYKFLNYIYHCNAQTATGEAAFKSLTLPYGWSKYPLVHRLLDLDEHVSMTFIYGSRSWIDKSPGEFLRDCLSPNRVTVNIMQGSGHHVYADNYNEFNELVKEACSKVKD